MLKALILFGIAMQASASILMSGYVACESPFTTDIQNFSMKGACINVWQSCSPPAGDLGIEDWTGSADLNGSGDLIAGQFYANALYGDGYSTQSSIRFAFHLDGWYDVIGGSGPVTIESLDVGGTYPLAAVCDMTVNDMTLPCMGWPDATLSAGVEYGRPFHLSIDGLFVASNGGDGDAAIGSFGYDLSKVITIDGERSVVLAPEPPMLAPFVLLLAGLRRIGTTALGRRYR